MSTLRSSEPIDRDLPRDIIIHILSFLPVRSVLRFKSVSKSWYAFLTSPNFISKHLASVSAAAAASSSFIFTPCQHSSTSGTTNSIALLSPDDSKLLTIPINLNIRFLAISKPLRVSGSSNGLICLAVLPLGSIILLWNPVTRQFKDLPISRVERPSAGPIKVVLGFGFDQNSNDYKVLRIVYYAYPMNQVEVYSLGSDSWKDIKAPPLQFLIFESSCSVIVNGMLHWTAIGFRDLNGRKVIVRFDLCEETFQYVMPPDFRGIPSDDTSDEEDNGNDSVGEGKWNLVNFKGSLGLIVCRNDTKVNTKKFDLWMMSEYGVTDSWTKCLCFEIQARISRTLACGTNGQILLETNNGELVLYDTALKAITNVQGACGVASWSDVFMHVDSLLSIRGGKLIREIGLDSVGPDRFFVRKFDLGRE